MALNEVSSLAGADQCSEYCILKTLGHSCLVSSEVIHIHWLNICIVFFYAKERVNVFYKIKKDKVVLYPRYRSWIQPTISEDSGITMNKEEYINTVVIGAGQAGIATSEHLKNNNIKHVVLEKSQIADSWRNRRWDSLVANGPAWHDRFPNMTFEGHDKDSFVDKESVADYFVKYVDQFKLNVKCGTEVKKVTKLEGRYGFKVETNDKTYICERVVVATGAFQSPVIPPIINDSNVEQIHSANYFNPEQLPEGNVLVIGSGSSGVQIADELNRSGKKVFLSVGPHNRPPRQYRGRDFCWWLGVLGEWDDTESSTNTQHIAIAVSGARGGHTVDFKELAANGVELLGMSATYSNGVLSFNDDLTENVENGNANYLKFLDDADAYIEKNGLNLPEEPDARKQLKTPECMLNPTLELNLEEAGITSVIWATGFKCEYEWLQVNALDDAGKPSHQRGVSSEPGVYFVGLPWLSRRGSAFIWGVWHDAKYVVDHMLTQQSYFNYHEENPKIALASESAKEIQPSETLVD